MERAPADWTLSTEEPAFNPSWPRAAAQLCLHSHPRSLGRSCDHRDVAEEESLFGWRRRCILWTVSVDVAGIVGSVDEHVQIDKRRATFVILMQT